MDTLSPVKKKLIIQQEPTKGAKYIFDAIQMFENLDLSDFPNMAEEKKGIIKGMMEKIPNQKEVNDWKIISTLYSEFQNNLSSNISPSIRLENAQSLLSKLGEYINNWESSRPADNHVDDANRIYPSVDDEVKKIQLDIEEEDWNNINFDNQDSLLRHLNKYPNSVHKDDIDDLYWDNTDKEDINEVDNYITRFPQGKNKHTAETIKKAIVIWLQVKESNDIFEVSKYVKQHSSSPFIQQAKLLLLQLKQVEITRMKDAPNAYEVGSLMRFLNEGVFTDAELIQKDVLTQGVLQTLRNTDIENDLPDIQMAIDNSTPECKDGHTDIYFFGIPSTGKTCILMGLSRSNSLHINLAHGGGDYAAALQQYIDAGMTVPQTKMGFVATLEATINERETNSVHKINLIEMAGEDFARKIAGNQEHIYDFDAMGTGATDLLRNNNKKVFFLIIDPTTNVIRYNRREVVGYNEETGEPIYDLVNIRCNQQTLIDKMVALFAYPGNADIMRKVNSIHIIMTKADLLGDSIHREDKAYNEFMARYGSNILDPLIDLCREYNINVAVERPEDKYCPKLYTFSLGKFYVGGIYEYDSTDSNKLVNAIRNATGTVKKKTLWDKIKEKVN